MDFLNRSLSQLRDLFQSMTPAARVTTGLLLVTVVVSLGYLFLDRRAGNQSYLFGGAAFSTGELQAMEKAFGAAGLTDFQFEGSRVRVPRNRRDEFVAALGENDALPYNFGSYLQKAVETGGMLRSGQERREAIEFATEQELSRIIGKMSGLEWAAVFYSSKAEPGLRARNVATASVTVKPVGNTPLDPQLASGIRRMVAAAFADLQEKDVTVIDHRTGQASTGDPDNPANPADNRYIATQRSEEQHLEEKIRSMLAHIPGLQVQATVILKNEWLHQEEKIEHNPKPVAYQTVESETSRTVENPTTGGRVGAQAQANAPQSLAAMPTTTPREEETSSETQTFSALSSTRTKSENYGMTVERATVALMIPRSYFEKLWREQQAPDTAREPDAEPPAPDPAELAQIQNEQIQNIQAAVATILPEGQNVTDKTELVSVTVYQDIQPEPLPGPTVTSRVFGWLAANWSTAALVALVVASLFLLRGMLRTTAVPAPAAASSTPLAPETAPAQSEGEKTAAERRLRRFATSGASLQEELSELVNEDPDAAANILRTWIGNVG